jgi:hypothetical protein
MKTNIGSALARLNPAEKVNAPGQLPAGGLATSQETTYEQRVANELSNHSGVFKSTGIREGGSDEVRRFSWKVGAFEYASSTARI